MVTPIALYRTRIRHSRKYPVSHTFSYRGYWWLLDLDRLDEIPNRLRAVLNIRSGDYCGDPGLTVVENVRDFLRDNGCDPTGMSITMLTTPRQLGYSFNPITLFYCRRGSDGTTVRIAEVHNTYGGRHRYLLPAEVEADSGVTKGLYVSPFFDVSGSYRIHCPLPDARLNLAIRLDRPGEPAFWASVTGRRVPTSAPHLVAALTLGSPLLTIARIRFQGIRLWTKRLPVVPRQQYEGAKQ